MTSRQVDGAMLACRPAKNTVRRFWLERIKQYTSSRTTCETLYLTLAGREGYDIKMLIDEGLIRCTETGAIVEQDNLRVVAIESSLDAARTLQEKFPGLKIVEKNVKSLIRGDRPICWPEQPEREYCRALVVNLDLDEVLSSKDGLTFPVLSILEKFITLHGTDPAVSNWSLFLTLHGEAPWDGAVIANVCAFLDENFSRDADFATKCKIFLGEEFYNKIIAKGKKTFTPEEQRKILMVFVPKKIAQIVYGKGWKVTTTHNLVYGADSAERTAPMNTWILDFVLKSTGKATPDALYKQALGDVLSNTAFIDKKGKVLSRQDGCAPF